MSDSTIPLRSTAASIKPEPPLARADEVADLLHSLEELLIPFIRAADRDADTKSTGHGAVVPGGAPRTTLVEHHPPHKLQSLMDLDLPGEGKGKEGVMAVVKQILQYSVNTWDQGFLDKLYHGNNAIGLASELLLATLNTNAHVYNVSPALTLIEKAVTRHLAQLFGLSGSHAGGVSQPGGSASNLLALLTARNTRFPTASADGLTAATASTSESTAAQGPTTPIIFTSAHAHYSITKAAAVLGLGQRSVRSVPVDARGRMTGAALATVVEEVRSSAEGEGKGKGTPFFVCATAGTTVLGAFDELDAIADVCAKEGLWLHVDASWGGGVVFSEKLKKEEGKLDGVERADSVVVNPHKMLGVSLTCSFLLVRDVRLLHRANRVSAGYLFHGDEDGTNVADEGDASSVGGGGGNDASGEGLQSGQEVWDLADLTPQCGRKGDALKMFLGWLYYGSDGYAAMVDRAFATTSYLATMVQDHPHMVLISEQPPPCLQVCFYYAKDGKVTDGKEGAKKMGKVTSEICRRLMRRGFMVDYAPGDRGMFLRVVVNTETRRATVEGLVKAVEEEGKQVWEQTVET